MLIFILPAAFYLRLVKSLPFRSPQKIGVSLQSIVLWVLFERKPLTPSRLSLSLAPQAAVFLIVGVVFMIGSLSLIVLDWIHNPSGSSGGH